MLVFSFCQSLVVFLLLLPHAYEVNLRLRSFSWINEIGLIAVTAFLAGV